jgi:hypothetical protein
MYLPAEIENPVTGEQIKFDESASNDERLIWDEWRPTNLDPPPVHYHPTTEERFEVRAGRLIVDRDGETHTVGVGKEVVSPPGTPHVSYTESESARFRREARPPGRWREALTARFAAVHANGELSGAISLLQTVLLAQAYPGVVIPAQPPRAVQRVLFPVFATIGRAAGLKAHYRYPRSETDEQDGTRPAKTP